MARIAFPLADGFEDQEFATPHTTLAEHGHDVVVVATELGGDLTGKRGEIAVSPDVAIDDIEAGDVDGVVIAGGWSPDRLRTDDRIVAFVREVMDAGRPVGAICHAGSLLVEADRVKGRTMTSWPSIRTDLRNAGATVVDEELVVDANLITSRDPDDLPAFTAALVAAFD